MEEVKEHEADILRNGIGYRLVFAVEWHTMRHHAACGMDVKPTHGRTWDQLGDDLAARFPPHIWHPSHWDTYEAAYPPAPPEETGPPVPSDAPASARPRTSGGRTQRDTTPNGQHDLCASGAAMRPLAQTDPLPDLLHRLATRRCDLTPWEATFVDAVLRRLRAGGVCTVRQRAVLATMARQYLSPEAATALGAGTRERPPGEEK